MLQMTDPDELKNYFRYDATISRDYYRAITALEKMQAARRREEDRQERQARDQAPSHEAADKTTEPLRRQLCADKALDRNGFVSHPTLKPGRTPGGDREAPQYVVAC
jgi:hypothetical protein